MLHAASMSNPLGLVGYAAEESEDESEENVEPEEGREQAQQRTPGSADEAAEQRNVINATDSTWNKPSDAGAST